MCAKYVKLLYYSSNHCYVKCTIGTVKKFYDYELTSSYHTTASIANEY